MPIKFLAFGAHPDDVEMSAAGTILKLKQQGHWVGIVDLSRGELGTRGSAETRAEESKNASKLLKLDCRENLDLGDGNIENTHENRIKVVRAIRKYKPDFVFINSPSDRHIDHGKAAQLVLDSCYLSGLIKFDEENNAGAHRPINIFHYIQDYYHNPSFVVDITEVYEEKMKTVFAYTTQFYQNTENHEPDTPISSKAYLEFFKGRAAQMGRLIGKNFGEGFIANQPMDINTINWF